MLMLFFCNLVNEEKILVKFRIMNYYFFVKVGMWSSVSSNCNKNGYEFYFFVDFNELCN